MIFNNHIKRTLLNEYAGSEKKKTVILDDGYKYLLKFPDPTREKDLVLSYINNAISEYVACQIFASTGMAVQDTILGEYITDTGSTKIACACKDVRHPGETMYEINKLELSSLENIYTKTLSLEYMNEVFRKMSDIIPEYELKSFYYDMFIVDTLVGNTDRHNGNWAILESEDGVRISPVYDCGSSLSPLVDEKYMNQQDGEKCAMDTSSVLKDENGKKLKYFIFFTDDKNLSQDIKDALKRMIPKINLKKIDNIIYSTPYISDNRKDFYFGFVHTSYERILLPAFEKSLNVSKHVEKYTPKECYDFYKQVIEPIKRTATYERQHLGDTEFMFSKAGNSHAIIYKKDVPISVISCRSNNRETRLNIQKFSDLSIPKNFVFQKNKIEKDKSIEDIRRYDDEFEI